MTPLLQPPVLTPDVLCVSPALVAANFSSPTMNAQGFPCQNSNTLPRSSHPMSPRTTMLRRRQKKKEHKSSCKSSLGPAGLEGDACLPCRPCCQLLARVEPLVSALSLPPSSLVTVPTTTDQGVEPGCYADHGCPDSLPLSSSQCHWPPARWVLAGR